MVSATLQLITQRTTHIYEEIMINILHLGLELYFAAMLGVAGLAKIKHPAQFAATLRRHGIFPAWSIVGISRIVPWLQIAVAVSLVTDITPVATAVLVLMFFISFLIIETILVVTKRATECGCYGIVYPQKVDGASIMTSIILVLAATLHLWIVVTRIEPLSMNWRLLSIALFFGTGCWLLSKMMKRHFHERRFAVTQNYT
jgi:hypothetical protein